jgi:hypothetical protein
LEVLLEDSSWFSRKPSSALVQNSPTKMRAYLPGWSRGWSTWHFHFQFHQSKLTLRCSRILTSRSKQKPDGHVDADARVYLYSILCFLMLVNIIHSQHQHVSHPHPRPPA